MFRTDVLSIIRSLNTVFTAIGIFHTEILKIGKILKSQYDKYQLL